MITYIEGDIFQGTDDVIVHGCNCLCNFGAGIALQVLKNYPEAYAADKQTRRGDESKLGTFTSWTGPHCHHLDRYVTIVNAYTQYYPSVALKPFDYEAFDIVLPKIRKHFFNHSIAMPKIGAGLAGGKWDVISALIEDVFPDKEIKVYVLK